MSHQDREQKRPIQTEFVRSVDELSPEDIHSNERKKGILSALFENSRSIMLFFCCALLIFSVCYVGNSISHYIEADSVYSNTAEMMNGGSSLIHQMYSPSVPIATPDYSASQTLTKDDIDNIGSSGVVNKDYERIRSRLTSMKAEYPNLYGWITIPNTNIDLPVMQTDDNDYYLNHAYNDKYLSAGAIFVDYRCDSSLERNYNLVVYGHHMVYGGMFKPLDKFLSEKFFRNNDTIYFYTVDAMYTYKVFSVYSTDKYDPYIRTSFPSPKSFLEFCNARQGYSIHSTKDSVKLVEGNKIITLSTCTNRVADGRIALHAVLVDKTS